MKGIAQLTIFLVALNVIAGPAFARTWHVARDGSGDYQVIQEAVDVSSPGDTILIGPGKYPEFSTVRLAGWDWDIDVYVYVTEDDLTLIGAGAESVIIGPEAPSFADFGPKGIVSDQMTNALTLHDLSIINVYDGIYFHIGSLVVDDTVLIWCGNGMSIFADNEVIITDCRYLNCEYNGIACSSPTYNIMINGCSLIDCYDAIRFQGVPSATVHGCHISGGRGGIIYTDSASGSFWNCTLDGISHRLAHVGTNSSVEFNDNVFIGGQAQVEVYDHGHAHGVGNVFYGGEYAAVLTQYQSSIELHGCHILKGIGASVRVNYYSAPDTHFDLTGNYWGTTDAEQISAWIRDGYDDPSVHAFVDFEPFEQQPIGTEPATMGRVKAMYR